MRLAAIDMRSDQSGVDETDITFGHVFALNPVKRCRTDIYALLPMARNSSRGAHASHDEPDADVIPRLVLGLGC
jgi:hypothetical protein